MTPRERFLRTLNFEKPDDRLPMIEWAGWWNQTVNRWKDDGLPADLDGEQLIEHFGLDQMVLIHAGGLTGAPKPEYHGGPLVTDEDSYEKLKSRIMADSTISNVIEHARAIKERHDRGEIIVRLWLDGYFWFPRTLFGIEPHMYAFYDQPGLMHRMNKDLTDFNLRVIEALFPILKPDMVGFAEDMSYNHGPMLSRETFNEFLLPYYRQVVPAIKAYDVKVLCDSDGDVTDMIPWFLDAGIEGVYPLERQAGVNVAKLRHVYPSFVLMGGYDKMVMSQNEAAMRTEFERLLPLMRTGGFIPSVDHQTPPEVSLDQYRIYVSLFQEYCKNACK